MELKQALRAMIGQGIDLIDPKALFNNLEEAEHKLSEWCKAHPEKTRMSDFFEKFPDAPRNMDGTPRICADDIGYVEFGFDCDGNEVGCCGNCLACWSKVIEEKKVST